MGCLFVFCELIMDLFSAFLNVASMRFQCPQCHHEIKDAKEQEYVKKNHCCYQCRDWGKDPRELLYEDALEQYIFDNMV